MPYSYALQVRLTEEQEKILRELANETGVSLSSYIRVELLKLAKKKKKAID